MRGNRLVPAFVGLVLLATGCSSSDAPGVAQPEAPSSTTAPTTTATSTAPTTSSTAPPTTTTATTSTAPTTSSTGAPDDAEPPGAPTAVTCAPGGGSGEVYLEWDAPDAADGVVDVRIYVDDGAGFVRLDKLTVGSEALDTSVAGGSRWGTVVYPIWPRTPVQVAVTHGDEAGNESGWNPIEVDYDYLPSEYAGTCG